jgi:hypothetical protein
MRKDPFTAVLKEGFLEEAAFKLSFYSCTSIAVKFKFLICKSVDLEDVLFDSSLSHRKQGNLFKIFYDIWGQ